MTSQVQAVRKVCQPLYHGDAILGILPFGHIFGLMTLVHHPLTVGVPVIVLPKFDLENFLRCIEKVRMTRETLLMAVQNHLDPPRPACPHRDTKFPPFQQVRPLLSQGSPDWRRTMLGRADQRVRSAIPQSQSDTWLRYAG